MIVQNRGLSVQKNLPATFLCIHRRINFGIRPIFASIPDIYTKSNRPQTEGPMGDVLGWRSVSSHLLFDTFGGESGIRTHGPFEPLVFKTSSLNRSDTSPYGSRSWNRTSDMGVKAPRLNLLAIRLCWSTSGDSNSGPTAYETVALPTELQVRMRHSSPVPK